MSRGLGMDGRRGYSRERRGGLDDIRGVGGPKLICG